MAAVAAIAMRAVEIRQLNAAPGKLEQTAILIQQLTHRSHLPRHRLAHQPNRRALPFTDGARHVALQPEGGGRPRRQFTVR